MLEKNQIYEVEIVDNGYQGEGIAKIDNITVFIEGAIKGETAKIKILKVQSNYAFGKILEIIKPSENRKEADCNIYTKCGGCTLRHIKYEETLNIKKYIVENCMNKLFANKINVKDIVKMEKPLFYRNKLQSPLGVDAENKPVIGVYSSRSHNIVATNKCYIQNEICTNIANSILEFIKENKISIYNENTLKGTVRHIIIRIGINTNEVLVTLVLNDKNFKKEKEFVEYITNKFTNIKTIVKNFNSKNTNVILGSKNEILFGSGFIYDKLEDYKFKISPLSFYQVNPIQTEKLYNLAMSYIKSENKNGVALDLYCGIGTIGIFAAKYFNKVYGVEIIEQAIEDAKENAKINKIENIDFFAGDVELILPEILEKINKNLNVVFLDPPRKGLDKNTIEILKKIKAKQIIYISCNPATLARDLKTLENEYNIEEITPLDMFPFTSHVECVAVLCRKENIKCIEK